MRRRPFCQRFAFAATIASLSLGASAVPASAQVGIGQVAPAPLLLCDAGHDLLQPQVSSGNSYVAPANGTITSWSTHAAPGESDSQRLTMKVFRQVSANTYAAVGHDGPRELRSGALNRFPAAVPVQTGDVLGMHVVAEGDFGTGCAFDAGAEAFRYLDLTGDLPDGAAGGFSPGIPGFRVNIAADVGPTNAFLLERLKARKKKGIAILTVIVPRPGEVALRGPGIKPISGAGAKAARFTPGGKVKLKIKPHKKGKKAKRLERRLRKKGKAKLKVRVTYTPSGDASNTLARKVTLVRK